MKLVEHNTFYFLAKKLQKEISLAKFKSKWRRLNAHNLTVPMNVFPVGKVTVGKYTYGNLNCYFFGTNDDSEYIKIGSSCSIANDTEFLAGGEHKIDVLTTYPYIQKYIDNGQYAACTKGPIEIEDDVWIGRGCTILSGVTIGKGAVIGARSVVTNDIPPYAVAAGNPARILKYRFTPEIIEKLKNISYSNIELEKVKENIKLFTEDVNCENIERLSAELEKLCR